MARQRRLLARALSVWILLPALPAGAETRVLEDLTAPGAWERRWAEGSLERGEDRGRPFLRCTSQGDGAPALVANRDPLAPPLDLRGRFLRVWVRAGDASRLAGMEFRLSSDGLQRDWFAFRVPLFADEHFGPIQSGSWVALGLGFGEAEVVGSPDRSAIDSVGWWVRDHGAGAAVVDWGGLAVVPEPARGAISLTFDDGYDEHLTVAAPRMAARGMRGTAYVIPGAVGQQGYMSLAGLRELRDRYGWDVAAHHATPLTELEPEALERALRGVQHYLEVHGFAQGARHLAFPLGRYDVARVMPVVRRHFLTARLASAGPETLPPADPHRLRVKNVLRGTRPEQIRAAARRAAENREWRILMFHYLVDAPRLDTEYSIRDFERVVELLAEEGVPVRTLTEVWREHATPGPARLP